MIPVPPRKARITQAFEVLRKTIRGPNLIESVDPELYNRPRNLDIFPSGLGSFAQSKHALDLPLQYTLTQLKSMFHRSNREEDHIDSIYVSSAEYCKQMGDAKHEFLLLEVQDERIPLISNWAVLDRTVNKATPGTLSAISTSVSSNSPAQDRLRVSCYGDKDLLIKQCTLGPYEVLERLVVPMSTPLWLWELVILALETSRSRFMYNLMSAQCFWFASCVWECMQKLRPGSYRMVVAASNNRGKFGNFFQQDVNKAEVGDILYKVNSEIGQFRRDLARSRERFGRTRLYNHHEHVQVYKTENEVLKNELERLRNAAGRDAPVRDVSARDPPMRVTPWGFTIG
ncbi:hypothetical protein BDV93DRAFT_194380 [Ceratobasidium sp. AG-I]|nr:hypothetical protein BDV93DRAFT_218923 [Ceratobasidium sp. AG-I]KAF8593849.1 hypothetical protein BDV93DRAFT_194380 [Ceratobasidium sp. AG-I]